MTDPPPVPSPAEGPAAERGRRWWVPLLGVGSLGMGGVQALGGLMLVLAGMQVPGPAAAVFFGAGAAWLVPGLVLAASGVGVVLGSRWARGLSLGAVAAGAAALALVAVNRRSIPPAMADGIEYAASHPDAKGGPGEMLARLRRSPEGDPVATFRNPELLEYTGWTFTGYCCCPIVPWYLVVLLACAPSWGRRIAKE